VPPGNIPRLDKVVVVDTGTVPVPLAGCTFVEAVDVDDDDEVLDDDELEVLVPPSNTCWMRAVNCELVRVRALWLAILARPLAWLVSALDIALISESDAEMVDDHIDPCQ
jgi:hypothetical protein